MDNTQTDQSANYERLARHLWACEFDGNLRLTKVQAREIAEVVAEQIDRQEG